MNPRGRIAVCGAISSYNNVDPVNNNTTSKHLNILIFDSNRTKSFSLFVHELSFRSTFRLLVFHL